MDNRFEACRRIGVTGAKLGVAALLAVLVVGCEAFGVRSGGDGPIIATQRGEPGSGNCVGACDPDPGWAPVDCRIAAGIKKLRLVSFDRQINNTTDPTLGTAYAACADDMYVYTDATAFRRFEYRTGVRPSIFLQPRNAWQPPTRLVDPPICAPTTCTPEQEDAHLCDNENNFVLHIIGGPFTGYGGGLGISMQKLNGREINGSGAADKVLCTGEPRPECPPDDAEYAVRIAALDVSKYDGVSFWARRGPNSQMGLRVNVGDKYTDDDLAYLAYRQNTAYPDAPPEPVHCQRVRECLCRNHKECVYREKPDAVKDDSSFPEKGYYCGTKDQDSDTGSDVVDLSGAGSTIICGQTACNRHYPAYQNQLPDGGIAKDEKGDETYGMDPQFYHRPCSSHTFANGISSLYCFDPDKDPPPVANVDQCGDHWMTTVDLSTDWQFYKVPFKNLRQQGWAKKSAQLDLHAVSVVRFTWDVGWIDYWIDDLAFYKGVDN